MRFLPAAGVFILGGAAATAAVICLDDSYPLSWLPILMGVAVSIVASFQPWLAAGRLARPFCIALALGATSTFCLSTPPVTTRLGPWLPNLLLFALALGFLYHAALFETRGFQSPQFRAATAWLTIPLLGGCVLGYVSGGIGGADHMVIRAMAWFHLSREQAEVLVHYFRKGIHVSAYGFMGLSLLQAAICGKASLSKSFSFAMLTIFCMASFDELRQTTAPNRTGSAWDVALDMTGAALFCSIALLAARKKPTRSAVKSNRTTS